MKNTLLMKQPSASFGSPWREATPLGNGLTGALIYGGTGTEQIIFTRFNCWHNAKICDIPEMTGDFNEMRGTMDKGDYYRAKDLFCNKLREKGYNPQDGTPFPLGILRIETAADGLFKNYSRKLHMDTAISEISYNEKNNTVNRKAFISRVDDIFVLKTKAQNAKSFRISLNYYNDNTPNTANFFNNIKETLTVEYGAETIVLKAVNQGIYYGIAVYIPDSIPAENTLEISSDSYEIYAKCFSGDTEINTDNVLEELKNLATGFDSVFEKHVLAHLPLYNSAELDIAEESALTNEALLDEAYSEEASPVLVEKLWKFGRYLFISGTHEDGLPFPLYGLWAGEYDATWPQYVCNENVQISYWHAVCGNLAGLIKPLIRFFCSHMDTYRKAAKKLFGCRGIFVSVYSSPLNTEPYPVVPVIIHYISCAGWLCSHFYDYYKATGDKEYLEKYIVPFMTETALFYLDYAKTDSCGKLMLYPSVSPENSPENFMPRDKSKFMHHPMPTAKNATMDFGILKELLTNLICLSESGCKFEESQLTEWKKALSAIPEYMVNDKGAVCEWMDGEFEDNYLHRHLSHIYPLFPGHEITKDSELFPAFKKAVELRILGAQSGWSLAHMSGIYCAMGEGEKALECLDILSKSCLLDNLFTLHNDYRYTGLTLDMGYQAPVQLDANLGAVNAVQMMLMQSHGKQIEFLPALPERLSSGKAKNFAFDYGKCSFEWDIKRLKFNAEIKICRDTDLLILLPDLFSAAEIRVNGKLSDLNIHSYKENDIITVKY